MLIAVLPTREDVKEPYATLERLGNGYAIHLTYDPAGQSQNRGQHCGAGLSAGHACRVFNLLTVSR